jgi:hypothetical protein
MHAHRTSGSRKINEVGFFDGHDEWEKELIWNSGTQEERTDRSMSNPIIRTVIRTKFLLTPRKKASQIIRAQADAYLNLAERMGAENGAKPVTIPPMIGVDPEMRGWSFFQILEHNAIVNAIIHRNVRQLALGNDPTPEHPINPKTDVLPQGLSGPEQVETFRRSIDDYLAVLESLPPLRGTAETPHPLFGSFDAHKWHCMFGFHLGLHLKQAEKVVSLLPS